METESAAGFSLQSSVTVCVGICGKCSAAYRLMRLRNASMFSGFNVMPAAMGCPPNLMSKSPHAQMASNSEKPSMLLPLPFASVSPREMIMHGLPQRSVTRDATMPITPLCHASL